MQRYPKTEYSPCDRFSVLRKSPHGCPAVYTPLPESNGRNPFGFLHSRRFINGYKRTIPCFTFLTGYKGKGGLFLNIIRHSRRTAQSFGHRAESRKHRTIFSPFIHIFIRISSLSGILIVKQLLHLYLSGHISYRTSKNRHTDARRQRQALR